MHFGIVEKAVHDHEEERAMADDGDVFFRGWIASRPEEHKAVVGHGTFFVMVMDRFLDNPEVHPLEL